MIKQMFLRMITFTKTHRWFTLFIIVAFLLNLYLILHKDLKTQNLITCSTYDRGPLGTYGLYKTLEEQGVSVKRAELPVFKVLDRKSDSCKTLVILSPLFKPQPWEWDLMIEWVSRGNRLITSGLYGIDNANLFSYTKSPFATSSIPVSPTFVTLPVDSVFPYNDTLAIRSELDKFLFPNKLFKSTDTISIRHFTNFGPDALPLLVYNNKVTAQKKNIGHGEWIVFTDINPFSNSALREASWFTFAIRLLTGDGRFDGKPLIFDEFHNGYRASKGLWQLLTYYKMDEGIIYLSILLLLYLFITGIRIISPASIRLHVHRDPIPGLRALSGLLMKFGAWKGLLKKEAALIRLDFSRKNSGNNDIDQFTDYYCARKKLPQGISCKEDLARLFTRVENGTGDISKDESIRIFNTYIFMRKEMRL